MIGAGGGFSGGGAGGAGGGFGAGGAGGAFSRAHRHFTGRRAREVSLSTNLRPTAVLSGGRMVRP
ncbi:hypothetical protein EDF19_3263 [Curtobacterium sp. PhB115]|nr:hypothetical protein EDF19_3263 [Curtobacterium sp. PhB115]